MGTGSSRENVPAVAGLGTSPLLASTMGHHVLQMEVEGSPTEFSPGARRPSVVTWTSSLHLLPLGLEDRRSVTAPPPSGYSTSGVAPAGLQGEAHPEQEAEEEEEEEEILAHPFVGEIANDPLSVKLGYSTVLRADRRAFTLGVDQITLGSLSEPAVVGCLSVFHPLATPVLCDREHRPVVASARCEARNTTSLLPPFAHLSPWQPWPAACGHGPR